MLHIHRAERADGLVDALGALLAAPLPDPLAQEVVAVPTRGMERWLTQRMSGRLGASAGRSDGVCANVDFPSPRSLAGDAVATASGIEPDDDRWLPERAVWALLEVVDESLGEPWLAALTQHLDGPGRSRRFAAVRHLADLFDRYALVRPVMVRAWAAGQGDGWQAELWRRTRERIGQPSPAERLPDACKRLAAEPALVELPDRLSVFGLTRLPAGHLDLLRALAHARDVHLFLLHPSPALWDAVTRVTAGRAPVVRRRDDPTAMLPANRLLASWGHDAREMQLVAGAAPHADHHHATPQRTDTLLGRLQADVRADRPAPGAPLPGREDARPLLAPGDRSVQVHACHGRARQVEVLRDAILHVLDEDPGLEPRDVIVMCPDIETFAPLVHAAFGAGEVAEGEDGPPPGGHPTPPDLRVRLADRSLRQTNPLLGVVAELLDLAGERMTASQVLGLADREPVRRRFRLDADDVGRVEEWVARSGIRWGLDEAHRAPFRLDRLAAGTWRAGLDRLLVGVTMTEDDLRLFADILPLDDVESGAIDLAGRLAELVDRLQAVVETLTGPRPVAGWAASLAAATDALTDTTQPDAWQRAELQRVLDDVVAEAAGHKASLALPEIRALLADRLEGRPTRANFRTGHLTICTLVPMRSVPHRVVCLLGLDDGVFPRRAPRDGDDLTLDGPQVGDRDARTEDRQLLLDALLAATDRLVVTYTGNDERTNAPRPPAVPVGELLDAVDRTVRTDDPAVPARERVCVHHPLQPFDSRNFTAGALVGARSWSFDPVTLEGARALIGPRAQPRPFLAGPLPPADEPLVELEDLVRFTAHPARAFLRQRLGFGVADFDDEIQDGLPVALDGLGEWAVGDRLVAACLAGVDRRDAALAEIRRGTLPPGVLGQPVIEKVMPVVDAIVAAARAIVPGAPDPESVYVRVDLPGGRRLSGSVPGVCGDVLRTVTYSRVAPKHRLATWVRWLALTAAHPERPFAAVTVGRAQERSARTATCRIAPAAEDRRAFALAHLAVLVDLRDRGLCEPAPLYCQTSAAYAGAAARGSDPVAGAAEAWTSTWRIPKEDAEPEHELVLGGRRAFYELLAEPPRPGEDWEPAEAGRFGRWAMRLWGELLAREAVEER